jgi:hypothetical protein
MNNLLSFHSSRVFINILVFEVVVKRFQSESYIYTNFHNWGYIENVENGVNTL